MVAREHSSPSVHKRVSRARQQPLRTRARGGTGPWLLALALMAGSPAFGAATRVTTTSYDYDPLTGLLKKKVVEPHDSNLCLVTTFSHDTVGNPTASVTRNCNGSSPQTPGGVTEAAAPSPGTPEGALAAFAPRTSTQTYSPDKRFPHVGTNAAGEAQTQLLHAGFGLPASLTGADGSTTTWHYDPFGRKVLETRADGTKTQWTYVFCQSVYVNYGDASPPPPLPVPAGWSSAPCGLVPADASVTHNTGTDSVSPVYYVQMTPLAANGAAEAYTRIYFDTLGREIRTEVQGFDGSGSSRLIFQDTKYDRAGNVSARSLPYYSGDTAHWQVQVHDKLGRVTSLSQPTGAGTATTLTSYSGLVSVTTNPLGHQTRVERNAAGQPAQVTDAAGGTMTRRYDPLGNVVRVTDAAGNVVSAEYDLRGRRKAMYDPDLGVWSYLYNAAGELRKQTDAKGQITWFEYDDAGRTTRRLEPDLDSRWYFGRYANGSACPYGQGKLCEAVGDNGYSRRHVYDGKGRAQSSTTSLSGVPYTSAVAYDALTGRISSRTYPTGLALVFTDTALGYPWKVTDPRSGGAVLWTAEALDAAGRTKRWRYGNGVVSERVHHPDGTLATLSAAGPAGQLQSVSLAYDLARNVSARFDMLTGVSSTYSHDALRRLTGETRAGGALSGSQQMQWGYDAIGNMTRRTERGVNHIYNYNTSGQGSSRPHAVASVSGVVNGSTLPRYTYDANGNLTAGAGRQLNWTAANMLQRVDRAAAALEYRYTPEHERVTERYYAAGALVRTTVYLNPEAAAGGLWFEQDSGAAGLKRKHYVSAGGETVAVIVCTADPCSNAANSSTQYWHTDELGSVAAVSNAAGALVERMAYEPFGKRRQANGVNDEQGGLAAASTDRGYTGHEHMDEVGLVNMNGRVYDPGLGRFVSADPTVPHPDSTQSYNRYSYVRNNPLAAVDESGYTDQWVASQCYFCLDTSSSTGSGSSSSSFSWATGDLSGLGSGTYLDPLSSLSLSLGGSRLSTASGASWGGLVAANGYGFSLSWDLVAGGSTAAKGVEGSGLRIATWDQIRPQLDPTMNPMVQAAGIGLASLAAVTWGSITDNEALVQAGFDGVSSLGLSKAEGLSMAMSLGMGGRQPKLGKPGPEFVPAKEVAGPYLRDAKAGPLAAQTASVQGKPCVNCGALTSRQIADHIDPLVVQYYREGSVNVNQQRSIGAVQPHCPSCSAQQGGYLAAFSKRMKEIFGF